MLVYVFSFSPLSEKIRVSVHPSASSRFLFFDLINRSALWCNFVFLGNFRSANHIKSNEVNGAYHKEADCHAHREIVVLPS
jgi:hypothetical protein